MVEQDLSSPSCRRCDICTSSDQKAWGFRISDLERMVSPTSVEPVRCSGSVGGGCAAKKDACLRLCLRYLNVVLRVRLEDLEHTIDA
jgi:hypothetical protein